MARTMPPPAEVGPVVLDSSCWLEYFARSTHAEAVAPHVEHPEKLIVPVVTVYEVFKKIVRERGKDLALRAVAHMQRGEVVDLDISLALAAATNGLPLADSLIYATAQARGATLWTQDAHFKGLPGVKYLPKS